MEAEKTRLATQQKVFESLVARRLQVYPELYAILSDLPKAFDSVATLSLDLRKTLEQLTFGIHSTV